MINEIFTTSTVPPFHSRSRKLDEQRFLIDEKNKQKRKLSGKISSLPIPLTVNSHSITSPNLFDYKTLKYTDASLTPVSVNLNPKVDTGERSNFKDLDSVTKFGFKQDLFEIYPSGINDTSSEILNTTYPHNLDTFFKEHTSSSESLPLDSSLIENNELKHNVQTVDLNVYCKQPPTLIPISTKSKPLSSISEINNLSNYVYSPACGTEVSFLEFNGSQY